MGIFEGNRLSFTRLSFTRLSFTRLSFARLSFALLFALLALAMTASLLAGCGEEAQTRGTFSYAESSEPASLDPAQVEEVAGINVARYLFDGLVGYDSQTSEIKPAVAESWESNDDSTEYTFHLRKGVKFTDGSEVKAGDFVYGWTRALTSSGSTASSILQPVKGASDLADGKTDRLAGVQALDDYTLKVMLDYPMADFVSLLGYPAASPVPRQAVENAETKFAEHPTGNGPFRIREWSHEDKIVLERNPDYYGDAARLDEVTVRIIPNPATAVAELKAGNIDAVRAIPPGQTEALRNDSSVGFYQGAADEVRFLSFDSTKPPFDNEKVRQAFAAAIDRDTIANKVLQGQAQPADGLVPTNVPGHKNGAMPYKYDPEKAKSLLSEAGYPGGAGLPPLTLNYAGVGSAADVAQAIQAELREVGITVEIAGLEEGAFLEQMIGGNLSLFLIAWQADAPNVDGYLFPLFDTENIGATNVFRYSNPMVDDLLGRARSTTDADARIGLYNDAERKILGDVPVVPVLFSQQTLVYSPRVSRFVVTPLGDIALNEVTVSSK